MAMTMEMMSFQPILSRSNMPVLRDITRIGFHCKLQLHLRKHSHVIQISNLPTNTPLFTYQLPSLYDIQNLKHARTISVSTAAESSSFPSPPLSARKLIVYSKDDCPLCDGLKEKLEALIERAAFMPTSPLVGVLLEVRNIANNPSWEAAYAMQVPVMTIANNNDERVVPRAPPRLTADGLEKHLAKYL
jgi:hypothetical protein